jgi:3-isopropylmalate/(R)-2-methylmalate dehydratase small subunit
MEPFRTLISRLVPLASENVDTDQIIPARFLKTTSKGGLGKVLFNDWRYDASGRPKPDFILNQPDCRGAEILLAGNNFGCGSSREHAPWALADFGFRAIISSSFADIFRNNCLKNGILPITVDRNILEKLFRLRAASPTIEVTIDLQAQVVILPSGEQVPFAIDVFSRKCLLEGMDEMGYLSKHADAVARFETARDAR